jgi:hypothetical protein
LFRDPLRGSSLSKGECNDLGLLPNLWPRGGSNPHDSNFISKKKKNQKRKQKKKVHNRGRSRSRSRRRRSSRSTTEAEAEAEGEEAAKAKAQQRQKQKEKKRKKKKKKTNWIRPAPRASGLRPQLDSVVFPPHMRSVKKEKEKKWCHL